MQKHFLNQMLWGLTLFILVGCCPRSLLAQINYLALGDSFTLGVGVRAWEAFPRVLVQKWAAQGCEVKLKNKAWGGRTARGVFKKELGGLSAFKPDLVTLAVGTNDIRLGVSPDEYLHWVQQTLDKLEKTGIPSSRIWVLPQPSWHLAPVAMGIAPPGELERLRTLFNKYLKNEVLARGMIYLEMNKVMEKQAITGLLSHDLFHPNGEAYAQWADWIVVNGGNPCLQRSKAPYRQLHPTEEPKAK